MSLSSDLWTATGLFHCAVGLAVPELREPLLRIIREGTVESADMQERYAREAAVWFHLFGVAVVLQGMAWKQYAIETRAQELPYWWGWSVSLLGTALCIIMPQSGWPLLSVQGARILLWHYDQRPSISERLRVWWARGRD